MVSHRYLPEGKVDFVNADVRMPDERMCVLSTMKIGSRSFVFNQDYSTVAPINERAIQQCRMD